MGKAIANLADVTALPPPGVDLRLERDSYRLDWDRIGAYLDTIGLKFDEGFVPRQFAGGLANLNYLVSVSGQMAVLRRPPPGDLPPNANDMVREHRILSKLWKALPYAPRSFHLCERPEIAGAPFQLLEFRAGVAVRGSKLDPLPDTPAVAARLARNLVAVMAEIHSVDCAAVGLQNLGRPENFFARTRKGWIDRARLARTGETSALFDDIIRWLQGASVRREASPTLIHNDYKLDNLLLARDTYAPVAVLDWDMGTRGSSLFDLATLLSYWTEPADPACMHVLAQMPTARPGFPTREAVARMYSEFTSRPLDDFKPYRVLAIFKLSVVFHQLHKRYLAHPDGNSRYAGFHDLANDLLGFCRSVVQGKIF